MAALELNDQVVLLGSRDDVPRLLSAGDVLLLPSLNEAIPLTLIEAMATGLPCVASGVGGVPEVVANDESGFLAEPGSDRRFADCIESLIKFPESRRRMGLAARTRAEEIFDQEKMASAYYRLYREMLGVAKRLPANSPAECAAAAG